MRSSRDQERLRAHLKAAYAYSELSHARRLKVGAVLIKDDRVISVGYNGMPSGGSNICEDFIYPSTELFTKPQVVHAEQNVIAFAAKNGISTNEATLVITHSPCFECCKLLIQAGIKHIYYNQEYRDTGPIEFLSDYGVTIERIDDGKNETTTKKTEELSERDVHPISGLPENPRENKG